MKIVCLSDTHLVGFPDMSKYPGDICIHLGDLLNSGSMGDWYKGKQQLVKAKQHYEKLYFVPGNHDRFVEANVSLCRRELKEEGIDLVINQFVIYKEISMYFTPWMPMFYDWAFMKYEHELDEVYKSIPEGLDILGTHGPCLNINDMNKRRDHCGSRALKDAVQRTKPKYHCAGHIHPTNQGDRHYKDAYTTYINTAIMDDEYCPIWEPQTIEF